MRKVLFFFRENLVRPAAWSGKLVGWLRRVLFARCSNRRLFYSFSILPIFHTFLLLFRANFQTLRCKSSKSRAICVTKLIGTIRAKLNNFSRHFQMAHKLSDFNACCPPAGQLSVGKTIRDQQQTGLFRNASKHFARHCMYSNIFIPKQTD